MLLLGTLAPDFHLKNVLDDSSISPHTYAKDQAFVTAFICNHCPYVVHIIDQFASIANTYQQKGIAFIAISSNDIKQYPQDGPELMKKMAIAHTFSFPYCYDSTQEVAKDYQAACTPDLYLFNEKHQLVYRGQFDDSRPKNGIEVTGKDLIQAMDLLLAGQVFSDIQKPSMGCNIKWKSS